MRYLIRHDHTFGWTVTDPNAEAGSRLHFLESHSAALAVVARLESLRLGKELGWRVVEPHGGGCVYLVRESDGQTVRHHKHAHAARFLKAHGEDVARRKQLAEERDRARVRADVAIAEADRLDVVLNAAAAKALVS
jgi:hypothetical protein